MDYRQIDQDFAVSPQIRPEDVASVAAAGFRSIVCNRPDSEDGAWPHDEVEAAAIDAGLAFRFLPVVSGQISPENVRDMASALESLPKPILAYCRSGGRCLNLYTLVGQSAS